MEPGDRKRRGRPTEKRVQKLKEAARGEIDARPFPDKASPRAPLRTRPLDWAASEPVSTADLPPAESVSPDADSAEGPEMPKSRRDTVRRLQNVATGKVIWHIMAVFQGMTMHVPRNAPPGPALCLRAKP